MSLQETFVIIFLAFIILTFAQLPCNMQLLRFFLLSVFTKSWKWQSAHISSTIHESEFKMFCFLLTSRFILWLILLSEGCFLQSSLWSYLRSVFKYVFHFRSLFRLLKLIIHGSKEILRWYHWWQDSWSVSLSASSERLITSTILSFSMISSLVSVRDPS